MRCCRVVMPVPSAIWAGCMLARRRVSRGSPVFISSSVMVARLREGCMGWKEWSRGAELPQNSSLAWCAGQLRPSVVEGLLAVVFLYSCPAGWPQEVAEQTSTHSGLPTGSSPLCQLVHGSIRSPSAAGQRPRALGSVSSTGVACQGRRRGAGLGPELTLDSRG